MTEPETLCAHCALARQPGYETSNHGCSLPTDIPLIGSLTGVLLRKRCNCGCSKEAAP